MNWQVSIHKTNPGNSTVTLKRTRAPLQDSEESLGKYARVSQMIKSTWEEE